MGTEMPSFQDRHSSSSPTRLGGAAIESLGVSGICLILVLSLVSGCVAKRVLPPPPDPVSLADEIDPGPLEPLLRDMPEWVRQRLGVDGLAQSKPQAIADLAEIILDDWTAAPSFSIGQLRPVLALLRRVVILELHDDHGAPCDVRCLAVRAAIYRALDIPWFAERENFFGEMLSVLGPALGDAPGMRRSAEAIVAFLQRVFAEAPRHHRRIAARLLRAAPDSPQATAILAQLAARQSRDEHFARARDLYRLLVDRSGAQTGFARWTDLAGACYRSFSFDCGDAALAAARELAGDEASHEQREQLQGCEQARAVARRVLANEDSQHLAGRLRLGALLVDLGHLKRARRLYQRLRRDHPRDARPCVGLARVALADNLHARRAAELIRTARELENKGLDFYQMAVGMAFDDLMNKVLKPALRQPDRLRELLEPFLERLRRDIQGLARFDRKRADILELLVDVGSRALVLSRQQSGDALQRAYARLRGEALERIAALRRAYPEEPDVLRLQFLLARLLRDRGRALELLQPRLPAELARRVAPLRATVLRAQAAVWQEAGPLAAIPDALGDQPDGASLRTEIAALRARLQHEPRLWQRVERGLVQLIENAEAQDRARLHNNLGVALYEQGRLAEAVDAFNTALRLGADYRVPELNLLLAQPAADTAARLERLAEKNSVTGLQAKAWALHLAGTPDAEARAALRQFRQRLDADNAFCPLGTGGAGVVLADAFRIGFGYSSRERLLINLSLQPRAWLILPAPPTQHSASQP